MWNKIYIINMCYTEYNITTVLMHDDKVTVMKGDKDNNKNIRNKWGGLYSHHPA